MTRTLGDYDDIPYDYAERVVLNLPITEQMWFTCGICRKSLGVTSNEIVPRSGSGLSFVCAKCFRKNEVKKQ